MRLLGGALAVLTVALAGCLSGDGVEQASTLPQVQAPVSLPEGMLVHTGEQLVTKDVRKLLGAVPVVVQKLTGTRGAEPTLGITSSGAIFVASGDRVMRSTDNGETWETVYDLFPTYIPQNPTGRDDVLRNSDPYLSVDTDTDRVLNFPMFPVLTCNWASISDDDGASWKEVPVGCGVPVEDHQKVAAGRPAEGGLQPSGYPNLVYMCYNKLVSSNCAVSLDGGESFGIDNVVASTAQCGGLNGDPIASEDGTVFLPFGVDCGRAHVAVSTDNGQSWTVKDIDDGTGLGNRNPDLAVTPGGTAYVIVQGDDHRSYVYRSRDRFESVEGPFLASPPGITSVEFPTITAGDDGRIAVSYLGTRDHDGPGADAPDGTRWHLFVGFSLDAESESPTFVTTQVTPPEAPAQIGYIWPSGGSDPARNLLDFNDMRITRDGRVVVSFTDGCTSECDGNPDATQDNSRSRDTAIAILESGPSLRAAFGVLGLEGVLPGTVP